MKKTALFILVVLCLMSVFGLLGCSGKTTSKTGKKKTAAAKKPALKILEPVQNLETDQPQVTVKGQTEQGCKLKLDGIGKEVKADGSFSFTVELVRGLNRFTVVSTNKAGGSSEREVVINYVPPGSETSSDTEVQTQQSTRPGDTSTPQTALLGHWKSSSYTVIEEPTNWYFSSNRVISLVGSDPNNIARFDDEYTVASTNQQTFKMTIRIKISGNVTEDLKIAFSMDRWRMTLTLPDSSTISCYFVDEKQQP